MHQVASGVRIARSRYWSLNTGVIDVDGGVALIDAGVYPDELEALRARAGEPIALGVTTHAHWDHVLWSEALGVDVPRIASEEAAAHCEGGREALLERIAREGSASDAAWEMDLVGRVTAHPFGPIAGTHAHLLDLAGHASGHAGVWVEGPDVLFVGDMLSDIDPPALSGADSVGPYRGTLSRLTALVAGASIIVPGHGSHCTPQEAMRRIERDLRYLEDLVEQVDAADAGADARSLAALTQGDPRVRSNDGAGLHAANIEDLLAAR